jgi:hypothetical protein
MSSKKKGRCQRTSKIHKKLCEPVGDKHKSVFLLVEFSGVPNDQFEAVPFHHCGLKGAWAGKVLTSRGEEEITPKGYPESLDNQLINKGE